MRGGIPALAFAVVLLVGACDFQLLEPLEMPRWGISLTIPLINKSYPLIDVVDSSTIFHDTTSQELQIEFRGDLDTTTIDSSFLEVSLPAAASPPPINESVNAPNAADFFTVVVETVSVTIRLADLLEDEGLILPIPDPINPWPIPKIIWNAVANSPVNQQEGPFQIIDTTALVASNDFIKRFRYVQLSGTPLSSRFYTNVTSVDFPENIDTVAISLDANPLAVEHLTTALAPNTSDAQTTDLASAQLGSEMAVGIHIVLPTVGADPIIGAGTDPRITLEVILEIGGVDSLAITTARKSLLPSPPDPLPLPPDIQITEGVLRSPVTAPINQISLSNLGTSLPFDILFQLTFPNFASSAAKTDSVIFGPYTLQKGQPLINQDASIAGYTFYNPAGGGPLTEFVYELVVEILEKDIVLPLDGSPLGNFLADFEFGDGDGDGKGDLHFESIIGNFFLTFDTVPTTIDDIPTGFAGFQFGRLSLSLLLRNQIELPVMLDLELKGMRTLEGDSVSVPISADINYPGAPGAPAANGDTAYTLIILDGNAVRTYWLTQGARDTTDAWYSVTTPNPDGSIVDVMNLPPDVILVGGSAVIQGEGVVEAGKGVWGEFELIAPFAFVLPHEVTFLPVNNIPLPPMDEGTRTQIKTALISASLTSQVTTHFPIGGNISLLISDTTLFTLALDKLDSVDAGIPTRARAGDTTYYNNISDVLAVDSIFNVQAIAYYPEETSGLSSSVPGTRARLVEFFTTTGDTFWIGRLFEVELPSPKATNALGHVTAGGDTTQVIAMDAERVEWIASDKTLYMKPLITFYNTPDVRTVQATNTIDFTAFMSFNLTSDIITEEEPLDTVITATAPTMTTVAVGDTLIIDLALVIVHETLAITDVENLDLSAISGHPGIVAVARIRTDGNTQVMELLGVREGKAQVTVTADDRETTPVSVSFYVTVVP